MAAENSLPLRRSIERRPGIIELIKTSTETYSSLPNALEEKQGSLRWKIRQLWATRFSGLALIAAVEAQVMDFGPLNHSPASIGVASAETLLVFLGIAKLSSLLSRHRNELEKDIRFLRNEINNPKE